MDRESAERKSAALVEFPPTISKDAVQAISQFVRAYSMIGRARCRDAQVRRHLPWCLQVFVRGVVDMYADGAAGFDFVEDDAKWDARLLAWDVVKANALAFRDPKREAFYASPETMVNLVAHNMSNGVDEGHARHIPEDVAFGRPGIGVELPTSQGKKFILIDGNHRLWRCLRAERRFHFYVLGEKEEAFCRLYGPGDNMMDASVAQYKETERLRHMSGADAILADTLNRAPGVGE